MSWVLATLSLLIGSAVLWLASEFAAGRTETSLHVGNVMVVTLAGLALFHWLAWLGVGLALAVAGLWWFSAALLER